tara:strand:- start:136 stop:624 length:489 start_codon:yes stop_codon:yes gene_type:complete
MKNKLTVNLIFILILFFIDRVSKFLIIRFNNETEEANIILTPFLNLNLVWNEGIAFGLLSFNDDLSYRLVTLFISIVILILFFMLYKAEKLNRVALIMVIGGATGNFFDRIYYSAVPDFVEIYYKSFHWFIFNVADIFITLGVFCLIYVELITKDNLDEKKQ